MTSTNEDIVAVTELSAATADARRQPGWRLATGAVAAVVVPQVFIVGAQTRGPVAPQEQVVASLIVAQAVGLLVVAIILRRAGLPVWSGRGRPGRRDRLWAGTKVGAAAWVAQAVILLGLDQIVDLPPATSLIDPSHPAALIAVLSGFAVAVMAPLLEELVFRRVVFEALRRRLAVRTAIVVQALVFAVLHAGAGPVTVVATFIIGAMFAVVWMRHGPSGAVASHVAFNGITVVLALAYV